MGTRLTTNQRSRARSDGYTLIEMIVVIAMLSIMLVFAVPRFEGAMTANDTKKASRWLILQVRNLKQEAIKNRQDYILHLGLDTRTLWVTGAAMSEEQREAAESKGYNLPESLRIIDVLYPDGDIVSFGEARIHFSRNGYSDKAIIHLEDDEANRSSLLVEPFLPDVKLVNEYVEF